MVKSKQKWNMEYGGVWLLPPRTWEVESADEKFSVLACLGSTHTKPGMIEMIRWLAWQEKTEVPSHPVLHSKFKAGLGYTKLPLNKNKPVAWRYITDGLTEEFKVTVYVVSP